MVSQSLLPAKQPGLVRAQAMEILAKQPCLVLAQAMSLQHPYHLVVAPHRRQRLVGREVPPLHQPVVYPVQQGRHRRQRLLQVVTQWLLARQVPPLHQPVQGPVQQGQYRPTHPRVHQWRMVYPVLSPKRLPKRLQKTKHQTTSKKQPLPHRQVLLSGGYKVRLLHKQRLLKPLYLKPAVFHPQRHQRTGQYPRCRYHRVWQKPVIRFRRLMLGWKAI